VKARRHLVTMPKIVRRAVTRMLTDDHDDEWPMAMPA
jgi:hypothetical protein